jgi:hypothetical protein
MLQLYYIIYNIHLYTFLRPHRVCVCDNMSHVLYLYMRTAQDE